jgi:CubicO group peptidase (beta-lactamase class C family)
MVGRRGFLGAAAGIVAWAGGASAQVSGGGAAEKAKAPPARDQPKEKAKTKANEKPDEPPVKADERVARVIAPARDGHHLPGMVGALVRGDRLAAVGAVGVRKVGSDEPFRVTDRVHLGSCTKAMTATLVGMLVDEGKLSWGSTLAEVFPDAAPGLHPDFRTATLGHLLTHRAGLPHDGPWWGLGRGRSTTEQRRALLTRMCKEAPLSRPGTEYAYSNVGYALAGLIAEQVTGQPWEALMRGRLFEPLGMASAGFGPPGTPGKVDEPWGHREAGGEVRAVREDNAPSLGPAGTVHASVPDWAKFVALHLRGAQGKARLLKPSTFRTLHTPPPGREYAGGWFVVERSWAGGRALNHNGSNTLWFASVWAAPARDLAVLVATNQGGDAAESACEEAVRALLAYDASARPARPRRR